MNAFILVHVIRGNGEDSNPYRAEELILSTARVLSVEPLERGIPIEKIPEEILKEFDFSKFEKVGSVLTYLGELNREFRVFIWECPMFIYPLLL